MKLIIAALMVTAAVATPAMAQTYSGSQGMSSRQMMQPQHQMQSQRQMGMGSDAYAYSPPGWDSSEINSPTVAMDPDADVRHQLQIQSDLTDR